MKLYPICLIKHTALRRFMLVTHVPVVLPPTFLFYLAKAGIGLVKQLSSSVARVW